jgi:hypothetical protein
MNLSLVYPMFAMVVLTYAVATIMFLARLTAVRSGKLKVGYFKTYNIADPGEAVIKTARHYSNLFELPVLFYVVCIVAMFVPTTPERIQTWAWLFVAARVAHAYLHIGPNKLVPRMLSFIAGFLIVLGMWIEVVVATSQF